MTARELVKKYGLMYCADHAAEYTIPVLRGLAKIADSYNKVEFEAMFLAAMKVQSGKRRGGRKAAVVETAATTGTAATAE
jgi:hypothetical protein